MSHIALYRKYRSQTFGDLIGQEHVVRTLQNGIKLGRIPHAFLFTGPRGTGKTSTARLVAKALNCEHGPSHEPCNECTNCIEITEGRSLDVYEQDAASESGVEEVREKIVSAIDYMPACSRFRIFIIDEVHDLSGKAFDALLKTIEEPPAHIVFILATTEFNKVPATIRSRCQKFEFHRASMPNLVNRLLYVAENEGVSLEPAAATALARMADGGYRDALSLLEQMMLTNDGTISVDFVFEQLGLVRDDVIDDLLQAIRLRDGKAISQHLDSVFSLGRDPRSLIEAMLQRVLELSRAIFGIEIGGTRDAAHEAALQASATALGLEFLTEIRHPIAQIHSEIPKVTLPRLWVEAMLLNLCSPRVAQPAAVASPASPQTTISAPAVPPSRHEEPRPVPKVAVTEASAVPAVMKEPQVDPDSSSGRWQRVVATLSEQSKLARVNLEHTSIKDEGATVKVIFERQMNYDWVTGKPKVMSAIEQQWAELDPDGRKLAFSVSGSRAKAVAKSEPAVELPAEGERLKKLASEEFEGL